MGIIILPFLLVALIIGVISVVKAIRLMRRNQIGLKESLFGLVTSLIIFVLIVLVTFLKVKLGD